MPHDWVSFAKQLRSIAQTGQTYTTNKYELERYQQLEVLTNRMFAVLAEVPIERVENFIIPDAGYATPKVDPQRHRVSAPNTCWTWDVTYLSSLIRGQFFYLYMIVDVFSRKIIAAEVFEEESMVNSSTVIQRAVLREGCINNSLILHADNGSAMKDSALQATLQRLNVTPSYSRPQVSNDNAFSESLFRTCKYRPDYPMDGYADLQAARACVDSFVSWYNHEHRHSSIRFVTPAERHAGQDVDILSRRDAIYAEAKCRHPGRWSGHTRNWKPRKTVWLDPDLDDPVYRVDQQLEAA